MAQIDDKQLAQLKSLLIALQGLVDSLDSDADNLTPQLERRIAEFRRDEKCLYCGLPLGDEKPTRGCHPSCYNLLNQRIFRGKLTRAEAIANGWLNPVADKPGRKTSRPDPMRSKPAAAQSPTHDKVAIARRLLSGAIGKKAKKK